MASHPVVLRPSRRTFECRKASFTNGLPVHSSCLRIALTVLSILMILLLAGCERISANRDLNELTATNDSPNEVQPSTHPLEPAMVMAEDSYRLLCEDVADYSCVVVSRERVDGEMQPAEAMQAKVMHEQNGNDRSHSVYLKFARPKSIRGREVLFVDGVHNNQMLVRNGGSLLPFVTAYYTPDSPLAMAGKRYPITEFGIKRLVERMIEVGRREMAFDECNVSITKNVLLEDHHCTLVEIEHPVRRDHFLYHLVRVHVDDELNLPFRFESFDWPESEAGEPVLLEEYTYYNTRLNTGLSSEDFDRANPEYEFGPAPTDDD